VGALYVFVQLPGVPDRTGRDLNVTIKVGGEALFASCLLIKRLPLGAAPRRTSAPKFQRNVIFTGDPPQVTYKVGRQTYTIVS
jgi:hypothetical protein